MRLILLTLFLIAAVDGGIVDKVKGVFSGDGSFGQKLKNATIVGFKKLFENTALFKIRDKIRSMKDKVLKTLELTPKMMKSLEERLKCHPERIEFCRDCDPSRRIKSQREGDSITEVNEYSQVGKDLYQSDMVLTEEQAEEIVQDIEDEVAGENRAKRQAFKDHRYPNMLWSEGVNYYFHKLASREMRSSFEKGAKLWEQDTCINFTRNPFGEKTLKLIFLALDHNTRPFNNSESTIRGYCFSQRSNYGIPGGWMLVLRRENSAVNRNCHWDVVVKRYLSLRTSLVTLLDSFHTMSRHDRDDFITVNKHNIKVDWLSQFNKETTKTNDNYNMTYDYGSIMHYGGTSASFNKKPTMVPFDIDYQQTLGSPFISFIELSMLNEHYGCKENCDKTTSVKCEMGGFPHPRDCQRCICPGGYGGARCTERALVRDEQEDFETCHYWIESPNGTEIEVKLVNFTKGLSVDGCSLCRCRDQDQRGPNAHWLQVGEEKENDRNDSLAVLHRIGNKLIAAIYVMHKPQNVT
ncbi:astacin [Cooperia oncophora]